MSASEKTVVVMEFYHRPHAASTAVGESGAPSAAEFIET